MSLAALALVAYAGADLRPSGWLAAVSMVLPYIYWGLAILALVISFPHLRTSWSVRIPVLGFGFLARFGGVVISLLFQPKAPVSSVLRRGIWVEWASIAL